MLKLLSDRPDGEKLQSYCHALLEQRRADLEFIVLFGSMARGNWSRGSDYDLLIGLHGDDGQRLLDRMLAFLPSEALDVEVFPYSRSEWQRMFRECHPLLLEALEHGIVLWDRGSFAEMRERFGQWRRAGRVQPWLAGWKIAATEERGHGREGSAVV